MKKLFKVIINTTLFCMLIISALIICPQNIKANVINSQSADIINIDFNDTNKKVLALAMNTDSKTEKKSNKNNDEEDSKNEDKDNSQEEEVKAASASVVNNITEIKTPSGFINFFTADSYENSKRLGIAVGVFFLFLMFRKIFAKYIFKLILKITSKTKTDMDEKFFLAFEKPLIHLFVILGIYFFLHYLGKSFSINENFITNCRNTAIIILISWGFYNLTAEYSILYDEMKELFGLKVDKILFPFISRCIRIIIVALALTLILSEWGKDIQIFITGLGLGGLAFSLAAQDAVSNIISGIILIIEKPFNIGDWVATSEVEGIVEDITFRSTRLRTFTQEIITVPNSKLASEPLTNYSKRGKRRITFNLGVTYDTSRDKIEICVDRIERMLKEHQDVHKETILVNFDKFNDSSLDIFLYFFTNTIDLADYLKVKEDINFKIMDILEEEGVSCAFPSTSVYFETPIRQEKSADILDDNSSYGDVI